MSAYNSIHIGTKIDNFDGRITALETSIPSHTTEITNLTNNKMNKEGNNTLTNSLTLYAAGFGFVGDSDYWGPGFHILDTPRTSSSHIRCVSRLDGYQSIQMETNRPINGSQVYNQLRLEINGAGLRRIAVTDAVAWCKTLGIPKILRGSIGLSNGQASLSFSSAFGAAPTVITSAQGTGTLDYSTHPGSVTAGGCKIFGTQQSGSGAVQQGTYSSVHWVAIGTWP